MSAEEPASLFTEPAYSVRLDSFEGPLDLLLHLIRKNEVNIYDIPISDITRQYLEYLRLMKELNLEVAGEFLVMASTLLQIKSKMLLPVYDEEEGEEEEEDPRAELVRRLLEYQKYKDAAAELAERLLLGRDIFARKFPAPELADAAPDEEPLDAEMFQLVEAFRQLLARIPADSFHGVAADTISVADRINHVLGFMLEREIASFDELFEGEELTREVLVATFLALLELCRLKTLRVIQKERYGAIWLVKAVTDDGEEEVRDA